MNRNRSWMKRVAWMAGISCIFCGLIWRRDSRLAIYALLMCLCLHGLYGFYFYCHSKKIRALSLSIDRLLHSKDYDNMGDFSLYQEGDLAILQNEIGKLVSVLKEQAEMLQKDKLFLTDSIADISHQLKTPLTSLHLVASMLMEPGLTDERKFELLEEASRLLGKIDWLIATLLKISRLDSGTIVMEKQPISFERLIEQALEPLEIPMELRKQSVQKDIQKESGMTGDLYWTGEALGNIFKNCMEHMGEGGTLWIRASENPLYSQLIVEDNGKGIAPEDLPHLFERFYRGKNAGNSSVGIGLFLARMIIGKQNGMIKAENREESGARFIIRFYKQVI